MLKRALIGDGSTHIIRNQKLIKNIDGLYKPETWAGETVHAVFTIEQVYQSIYQISQPENAKEIRLQGITMGKIDVSHERERVPKRERGYHHFRSCGKVENWYLDRSKCKEK